MENSHGAVWGKMASCEGFGPLFFGFLYSPGGVEGARNSSGIETGGLKDRLQARLPNAA